MFLSHQQPQQLSPQSPSPRWRFFRRYISELDDEFSGVNPTGLGSSISVYCTMLLSALALSRLTCVFLFNKKKGDRSWIFVDFIFILLTINLIADRRKVWLPGRLFRRKARDLGPKGRYFFQRPRSRSSTTRHATTRFGSTSIVIPKIDVIPYSHGGYFGASLYCLQNHTWLTILDSLNPEVFDQFSRRIHSARVGNLIKWSENNPIFAAYGVVESGGGGPQSSNIIPIEWDIFLDPALVRLLNEVNKAEDLTPTLEAAIFSQVLVAHGSPPQLVLEQLQCNPVSKYVFHRVKKCSFTLGGGVFIDEWLSCFAMATRMHYDECGKFGELNSMKPKMAMEIIRKYVGGFACVLDCKSRNVPKHVWALVIDALTNIGIDVKFIAGFTIDEIRGIANLTEKSRVKEAYFFHTLGDVQHAASSHLLRPKDVCFFNAGCLIEFVRRKDKPYTPSGDEEEDNEEDEGRYVYKLRSWVKEVPEFVRSTGVMLGCYVQEFATDFSAASLIISHVNQNKSTFALGLSWGGLNGKHTRTIGNALRKTDGLWSQRYVGKHWKPMAK